MTRGLEPLLHSVPPETAGLKADNHDFINRKDDRNHEKTKASILLSDPRHTRHWRCDWHRNQSFCKCGQARDRAGATAIAIPSPSQLSSEFSKIAKQVEPAVVNINTETIIKAPSRERRQSPFGNRRRSRLTFLRGFSADPWTVQGAI